MNHNQLPNSIHKCYSLGPGSPEIEMQDRLPLFPLHLRQLIYSYLPLNDIIFNVRPVCRHERSMLINSAYASVGKVFDWKFQTGQTCWMHGSELQNEMKKRSMILDHVQECRIILVHNQHGNKECEHSVSERVAEIILCLPERFEKKKVSILDQGNL